MPFSFSVELEMEIFKTNKFPIVIPVNSGKNTVSKLFSDILGFQSTRRTVKNMLFVYITEE